MPSTGLFDIKCAAVTAKDAESEFCVASVEAECLSCKSTISVEAGKGLETLPGGFVITCLECGSRQAVSSSLVKGVTTTT